MSTDVTRTQQHSDLIYSPFFPSLSPPQLNREVNNKFKRKTGRKKKRKLRKSEKKNEREVEGSAQRDSNAEV